MAVAGALDVVSMLRILREELKVYMALAGVASIQEIKKHCLVKDS